MAHLRARILTIGTAAVLTAASAASAAGCGAEDKAKDAAAGAKAAVDPVAQAATATQGQEGGIAIKLSGGVSAAGQKVPLQGDGVVDAKGRRGMMTITTAINGRSMTMEEVIRDKVVYIKSDLFAGKLPGGKTWLKVDLTKEAAKQGLDLDALGGSTTQDPAQALEYLKGAGASRKVGTETVNGTQTTHYHVDVDLRKVAAKSDDPDAKATVDKLIKMIGTSTMPVEVWVDGRHLVRREQLKYDMTVQGKKASLDMTIDLTRFGVAVHADAPPAGDVVDLGALTGGDNTSS